MATDWIESSIGDLVEIKHGFAFDGQFFRENPPGDYLLTPGNFAVGGGFKADKLKFYDGPVPQEFILRSGDLIVTMTDLSKSADTLGYPALVPHNEGSSRFLHNQRLGKVVIRDPNHVDPRFLYYVMCTREYRNEILASATGTTVKHTSPGRIKKFCFRLPTLSEQRSIAGILSSLDEKIELNHRMNKSIQAMVDSIFVDRFRPKTGGVNGRHSQGWRNESLLSLAELKSGGTPKTSEPMYWNGDVLWATAKDISQSDGAFVLNSERKITVRGVQESNASMIAALATLVVARGATTGRMAMLGIPMAMNQTCYALESRVGAPFTLYCLVRDSMDDLVRRAHGSVFNTITTDTFRSAKVLLPPQHTRDSFEQMASPMFRRILANLREAAGLARTRDTLLPRLLPSDS